MNIITFSFENNSLNATEFNGQAWFFGVEMAKALDFMSHHGAIRNHCPNLRYLRDFEDDKDIPDPFYPSTKIIPERDVYKLIMKSRHPAADELETIIFNEVVPRFKKPIEPSLCVTSARTVPPAPIAALNHEKFEESIELMKMALNTTLFSDDEKKRMFIKIQQGFGLPSLFDNNNDEKIIEAEDTPPTVALEPFLEEAIEDTKTKEPDLRGLTKKFDVKPMNVRKKYKRTEKSEALYQEKKSQFAGINPKTLSVMLKESDCKIKSVTFNKKLVLMGINSIVERVVKNRKGENEIRWHSVVKDEYKNFGVNVLNPYNKYETLISWNQENFKELVGMVEKFAKI